MKDYPSIPRTFTALQSVYVFDKLDGSNLRCEWSKKQGWYKFGKRTGLLDHTNPLLLPAPQVFRETIADDVEKVLRDQRVQSAVLFCEWWGPLSFAGNHEPGDAMRMTPIDVALDKKGILGPRDFLKLFGHLPIATYLGQFNWSYEFLERVKRNELPGVTFEGVVGKVGERHKLIMRKAKTQQWIDKVRAKYNEAAAERLINS